VLNSDWQAFWVTLVNRLSAQGNQEGRHNNTYVCMHISEIVQIYPIRQRGGCRGATMHNCTF